VAATSEVKVVPPPPAPPRKGTESDYIEVKLVEMTGITKSHWHRWTKYTVGSAADRSRDRSKFSFDFASTHPHLVGSTVRVFGAMGKAYAVFDTEAGPLIEDISLRPIPQ
jgi:hypothetical protein